jgi:hypothetical protein
MAVLLLVHERKSTMKALHRHLLNQPRAWILALIALCAFPFNLWIRGVLDASYAASKFPVPYFVQQLSFDAHKIKAWYAYMREQGTLGQYLFTQHIDYAFMLSVLMLHVSVLLLLSRMFGPGTRARAVMVWCALLSAAAPMADALENLVSYVMLADSAGFPAFLASIYSGFAATKFAMFVFAYAVVVLAPMVAAGLALMRLRRRWMTGTPARERAEVM